jgi:hypothetical protein
MNDPQPTHARRGAQRIARSPIEMAKFGAGELFVVQIRLRVEAREFE